MKTIKELNKELSEKVWYRLIKVLWFISYLTFIILIMITVFNSRMVDPDEYLMLITFFFLHTFAFFGFTVALKRAVYYTAYYIITGKVFLKELGTKEVYTLLLIALWGLSSIFILVVSIHDFLL